MENRPKAENGKNWRKNNKWPTARNGENMAQKWLKQRRKNKSHYFAIFGPFLPHFGPLAIFYFSANFCPNFGFRPVFHSMPGGLSPNASVFLSGIEFLVVWGRLGGQAFRKTSTTVQSFDCNSRLATPGPFHQQVSPNYLVLLKEQLT